MRASYVLGLRRFNKDEKDAHGNPRRSWADPVDWIVFGIAPSTSDEPLADRDAVVSQLRILAPPEPLPGPLDLVVIDGVDWKVVGHPADYTRGPFGYEPGVSVLVTREVG